MPPPASHISELIARLHGRVTVDMQVHRIFKKRESDTLLSLQVSRLQEMIENERVSGIYKSFYKDRASWVIDTLKKHPLKVQSTTALMKLCCSGLAYDKNSFLEILDSVSEGLDIHKIPPEVFETALRMVASDNNISDDKVISTMLHILTAPENPTSTSYDIVLSTAIVKQDFNCLSTILQLMIRQGVLFTNLKNAETLFKMLCVGGRKSDAETTLGIIHSSGLCSPTVIAVGKKYHIYGEQVVKNLLKFPASISRDSMKKLPRISLLDPTKKSDSELCHEFKKYTTRMTQLLSGNSSQRDTTVNDIFKMAISYLQKMKHTGHTIGSRCYLEAIVWCKLADDYVSAVTLYEESRAKGVCDGRIACSAISCMRTTKNFEIAKTILREYRLSRTKKESDPFVYEAALFVCQAADNYSLAKNIYAWMLEDGVTPGPQTFKALIAMSSSMDNFNHSCQHFKEHAETHRVCPSTSLITPPNPQVVFVFVKHVSRLHRWGEINPVLTWLGDSLHRNIIQNAHNGQSNSVNNKLTRKVLLKQKDDQRKSLGAVIHVACTQKAIDVCKRSFALSVKYNISHEKKLCIRSLGLALSEKDVFFAARIHQELVPMSSAAELREILFVTIRKNRIPPISIIFEIYKKVEVQKPGQSKQNPSNNPYQKITQLLNETVVAFCSFGHATNRIIAFSLFAQSNAGVLNTKKGLYTNSSRYRKVIRPLLRTQPDLVKDPVILCTICAVWNMPHFGKYMTNLRTDPTLKENHKPHLPKIYEIFDIVLSSISSRDGPLYEDITRDASLCNLFTPTVVSFILRGCIATMDLFHLRDSDGCRGLYYEQMLRTSVVIVSMTNSAGQQQQEQEQEQGDVKSESLTTLTTVLDDLLTGVSDSEAAVGEEQVTKHIGSYALISQSPLAISRLILDRAIVELQSNSGYLESNRPASKTLIAAVKQTAVAFPELSDWTDSFLSSVGAPKVGVDRVEQSDINFLKNEVQRLRTELLQERDVAHKLRATLTEQNPTEGNDNKGSAMFDDLFEPDKVTNL